MMTLQRPPLADLVERWRRVEALGFDSLWLADHLMQFLGAITYEAWSLLGAAARETDRVRIGALVTPITFRHPMLLAMSATTVDHLSGGRLELGIGAGGGPKDQAALGLPDWGGRERLDRLEEQLAILDALLRGEEVTREGRYYSTASAAVEPPIQKPRPPFVVAAQTPRALRLAARYGDAWNTLGGQPVFGPDRRPLEEAVRETRRQQEELEAACLEVGRDPSTIRRSLFVYKYAAFVSLDTFEEVVGRYREIGIDEFVFSWPSDPSVAAAREAVLERAASEVIPRLRATTAVA
jgi:alkanesulfonate monooxygenase SsuD/methylene tetrahydromethanopterin reductase-like flavin-dependent oxidoreductase (luciferase family)